MEIFEGFSRTPIRDALKRLTYEGYVENAPDRDMFAAQVCFKELIESFINDSRRGGVFLLSRDHSRVETSIKDPTLIYQAIKPLCIWVRT